MPPACRSIRRRAAVALALALAACTGATEPAPEPPQAPGAKGSATSPGRAIRFGVIGAPATLDPYSPVASDITRMLARPLYPSLYRLTPAGKAVPSLAASAELRGNRARVSLSELAWSDGTPVTARDVVASVKRARPPSGFALVRSARVVAKGTVVLEGEVDDWRQTLAAAAFVLPRGLPAAAGTRLSAGPFVLARYTPGLEAVFAPNPDWDGRTPGSGSVRIQFIQDLDIMMALLEQGDLDGALTPATVNLDDRLEAIGLRHAARLGWETIFFDLSGADLDDTRAELVAPLDRRLLEEGFVRELGRLTDTLYPAPGPSGVDGAYSAPDGPVSPGLEAAQIGVGAGDELTELIQRALRLQLDRAGFEVELVTTDAATFYGRWRTLGPTDIAIRRAAGAPGAAPDRGSVETLVSVPFAHVATVLAWRPGIRGMEVNPTLEGPLWNLQEWSRTRP